ncbi:MAG: SGNH/GDSL hydrolase family protein [Clostridia bacterium]|nr:SGNH/GDSL hydrolase family protein [Clostridia bacterium]
MDNGKLEGKRVLAIGDSITSDGRWQREFERVTGAVVTTHARGGVGIIDMVFGLGCADSGNMKYDPYTGVNGELLPLGADDFEGKDLVIFFGGYNERHMEYGDADDEYPRDDTLYGKFNTVMKKIISMKRENCPLIIVSPHCVGKYDWVDADGTEEFPAGSGRTLETMSYLISDVAKTYGAFFFDAYHLSGIGRENWNIYANSPTPYRADYSPSGHYEAPYPMYADQAHLNGDGYALLGGKIAEFALSVL